MTVDALAMTVHVPVLLEEVLRELRPKPGDRVLDGTLGGGGHTRALAERVGPRGVVLALDRDPAAVQRAEQALRGLPVVLGQSCYADAPEIAVEAGLAEEGGGAFAGIVLDLGLSSDQLAAEDRGFSFHASGDLDLRFDPTSGEPASRLVARLSAEHLADVIYRYGDERCSRRIARAVVEARRHTPIATAERLAEVVRSAVPANYDPRLDPATRTFQALRIAVNDELGRLERAMDRLPALLAPGGRLAVISFHSLEDRIVKTSLRGDDRLTVITAKPIRPTPTEIEANPRARSAKLRVARRRGGERV